MATGRLLFVLVMASIATVLVNTQTSPTLTTPGLVFTLYEDTTTITTLDTITCVDTDADPIFGTVDPTVASIVYTPTTGCPSCLRLEPSIIADEWDLKFYPAVATFDFTVTPSYFITVTCTDFTDPDTTANLEVRLVPNSYPTFDSGLAITYTLPTAQSVVSGDTVYSVLATDPNGDSVFYTMTMDPTTSNFEIGYADGVIKATDDLVRECNEVVTFTVTITDLKLPNPDNQVIVMTLDGYNMIPTITNLDATTIIPEDTAASSTLLTYDIVDDGGFGAYTISFTALPPESQSLFTSVPLIDVMATAAALDYEDTVTRVSQLIITIDDGSCPVSTYTYTVSITDVNEAPVIEPLDVTYEVYEGNIVVDPGWTTTDQDDGDTLTYTIKTMAPTGLPFQIDSSTGIISSTTDYDIDQGLNVAAVTFTIEVTDSGGLTDETTVILNIKDTNDNAPVFDPTTLDLYYTVTACGATGLLGNLLATDDDSAFQDNNVYTFHLATTSSTFVISESGEIILVSIPAVGTVESVKANAIDAGQYPGNLTSIVSAEITLTVTACTTTTSATATTTSSSSTYSGFSLEDNVWWIALAGLFAILFLALLTWLCISRIFPFCRNPPPGHWSVAKLKCCKRGPPKPKKAPKPPKKTFKDMVNKVKPIPSNKPKPGNDGFWKVVQDVINKPSPLSDSDRGPDRFRGPQGHDANRVHSPTQAPPLDDPLYTNRAYQEGFF